MCQMVICTPGTITTIVFTGMGELWGIDFLNKSHFKSSESTTPVPKHWRLRKITTGGQLLGGIQTFSCLSFYAACSTGATVDTNVAWEISETITQFSSLWQSLLLCLNNVANQADFWKDVGVVGVFPRHLDCITSVFCPTATTRYPL